MVALNRYRVIWTGGSGGTGLSTFYSADTSVTLLSDIRTFFNAVKGYFTDDVTWSFPSAGDTIESSTGVLVGAWTATTQTPVAGGATGPWVAGVGLRCVWETGAVIGGRRVRGSTFLTGLQGAAFAADGSIDATVHTNVQAAADALAATGEMIVWSRPGPSGSGTSAVSSARVPDKVSWLRSRRE